MAREQFDYIVDSHCHLDFPEFKGQIDEVVARAKANDVALMQTICTRMKDMDGILAIAETHDPIYASVGVHPNNVAEADLVSEEALLEYAKHPKVIGIGETGLDYYYENSPRELQQESFRKHIAVARQTGLPIVVHTRSADEDTVSILQEEYQKGSFPGLIHCFSTSEALAMAAIELDMYISISGIVTFKKATELQDIVKRLPLERLLVETDAPYLAPVPYRGKTNEPSYTRHTAEFVASLKGVDFAEVAQVTTANFFQLFSKIKPTIVLNR